MKVRQLLESRAPGEYVYHASYLPSLSRGLKSIKVKGLQPSKDGYQGPGVYFAYKPNEGLYHVGADEATIFRAKWADLVKLFDTYPANKKGIMRDDEEIVVPGAVPAKFLEVEYFPGEWWEIDDAIAAETRHED